MLQYNIMIIVVASSLISKCIHIQGAAILNWINAGIFICQEFCDMCRNEMYTALALSMTVSIYSI